MANESETISQVLRNVSKSVNSMKSDEEFDEVLRFLKQILPTSSTDDLNVLQQAIYYIYDLRSVLSSSW